MLLRNVCFRNIWKIIIGMNNEEDVRDSKTFKNRILLLFDEVNFRNALYNINAYINKVETKLVKNRECLKIVQWGLQAFCCYSIVKWCTPMKLERFPQKYLLSKTSEPFLQKFNNLLNAKINSSVCSYLGNFSEILIYELFTKKLFISWGFWNLNFEAVYALMWFSPSTKVTATGYYCLTSYFLILWV